MISSVWQLYGPSGSSERKFPVALSQSKWIVRLLDVLKKELTGKLYGWIISLQEYNFETLPEKYEECNSRCPFLQPKRLY